MPTLAGSLAPPRPLTRAELDAARSHEAGFFRSFSASVSNDWLLGDIARAFTKDRFEYDEEFALTPALAEELTDRLPMEYWGGFESAVSLEHAREIRRQRLAMLENERVLASSGWSGVSARVLANLTDPGFLAASALSGGLGAGARATRIGRFVQGGLVAAATDVPLTAFQVAVNPSRDETDILWSALGSLAVGGTFAAATRGRKIIELDEVVRHQWGSSISPKEEVADITDPATEAFLKKHVVYGGDRGYFRSAIEAGDQAKIIDRLIAEESLDRLDPDFAAELRAMPPEEALQRLAPPTRTSEPPPIPNAATGGPEAPPPKIAGDLDLSGVTDAPSKFAHVRWETVARLGRSRSPLVRRLMSMMLDDRIRKADGSPSRAAASGWVSARLIGLNSAFNRSLNAEFAAWARDLGIPRFRIGGHFDEFKSRVTRALREGDTGPRDPVTRAASELDRLLQETGKLGQRHGIRGFDRFDIESGHVPIVHSPHRLHAAVARFKEEKIIALFAHAMDGPFRAIGKALTDDELTKVATGYVRTVLGLADRSPAELNLAFSGADRDLLAAVLREEVKGIDQGTIESVLRAFEPDTDRGLIPQARRRTPLDVRHWEEMTDKSGTRVSLSIQDLLENDASALFAQYSRSVVGHAAEAEIIRAHNLGLPPEKSASSWDAVIRDVRQDLAANGADAREVEATLRQIDWAHRGILGRRLGSDSSGARLVRRIRAVNHLRDQGSFVLAAVGESLNLLAQGTLREVIQTAPVMRSLMQRARTGRLSNETLETLEIIAGLDQRTAHNQAAWMDDAAGAAEAASRKVDRGLAYASNVVSNLSGLAPVTDFTRRLAVMSMFQKIINTARSGRSFSKARLAALGLSESDWERIVVQVNRHYSREAGAIDHAVIRSNWQKWDDVEAASMLLSSAQKFGRRVIQDENLGDLNPFLTSDAGRIIFQFRRFALTAWSNHALHALDMHDARAFIGLGMMTAASALVYMGRMYAQSIGRDDAEEFREKYLAPDRIIRAAVSQSAWASVAPAAVDPILGLAGFDTPYFGFARFSQGVAPGNTDPFTAFLIGNPTMRGASDLFRGVGGAISAASDEDEDFSRDDARSLVRALMPLRNVIGVKKMLDLTTQQLPEE